MYSPFLPILISIILFVSCRVFDPYPYILCDDGGWTLTNLKTELSIEMSKFENAKTMKESYYQSYIDLIKISRPNYRNFSEEANLISNNQCWRRQMYESLDKIHHLERCIKNIDPNYRYIFNSG